MNNFISFQEKRGRSQPAINRSALDVWTKADLPRDSAATQNNQVALLRDVISHEPDDLSRYRLASALGDLPFMLVLNSQFAEVRTRYERDQSLINDISSCTVNFFRAWV